MVRRAPGTGSVPVYEIAARTRSTVLNPGSSNARITAIQKRELRKKNLEDSDIDILQDLDFPTVATRVKQSDDGRFLAAVGTYPPQVRVYEFENLAMKFQRNLDAEIVDFQFLTEDWTKLAFLCANRTVEVHAKFGTYYKTRIPKFGRDIAILRSNSDLYVCGAGAEVWRLNLEHGKFYAPFMTQSGAAGGNNCIGINPVNKLVAFGGDTGIVEIWDPRNIGATKAEGRLDIGLSLNAHVEGLSAHQDPCAVTCLRFDDYDGVTMGVGTSSGYTMLFDLRSPHAPFAKEQGFGSSIQSLRFLRDRQRVVSADRNSVKVWTKSNPAENIVTLEPTAPVNHLCVIRNSGIMLAAVEAPKIQAYYVPALGLAPSWCSFLDTFTEELEDMTVNNKAMATLEDNLKFVTRDELLKLNAEHLIGTSMLKVYMHGFYMHMALYRKLVDVADPFAYETYRKERIQAKLEKERESHIAKVSRKKLLGKPRETASANIELFKKMQDELKSSSKKSKKKERVERLLTDSRFAAMFADKDFEINDADARYKNLHPDDRPRDDGKSLNKFRRQDDSSDEEADPGERYEDDGDAPIGRVDSDEESGHSDSQTSDERSGSDDLDADIKPTYGSSSTFAKGRRAKREFEVYEAANMDEASRLANAEDELSSRKVKNAGKDISLGKRLLRERQKQKR